mmetsp:Transcript_21428/g.42872  ORF Transcript_21428/g.42872 Transcript_21428/m.42872 type:complete len:168 (-) Transcript_21428:156-659(-)
MAINFTTFVMAGTNESRSSARSMMLGSFSAILPVRIGEANIADKVFTVSNKMTSLVFVACPSFIPLARVLTSLVEVGDGSIVQKGRTCGCKWSWFDKILSTRATKSQSLLNFSCWLFQVLLICCLLSHYCNWLHHHCHSRTGYIYHCRPRIDNDLPRTSKLPKPALS